MDVYFDNSATTRVDDEVIATIEKYYKEMYANPSAMHHMGYLAEMDVKSASKTIADIINADPSEIIWTSGGSESNNLAIKGYIDAHKKLGKHIITTEIEHASVYSIFRKLEEEGFDVSFLKVDKTGHIDINELKDLIRDDTLLVSIMYVNNIIGAAQNIREIGNIIKEKNKNTVFHVDAVQGFTKYKIDVKKDKIDFLSVSSHKFHGPKGVGFLYKKKDIRINPIIDGGGQQLGLRSGTLNTPGILGTAKAAEEAYKNFQLNNTKLLDLKKYIIDGLSKIDGITINSKLDDSFAPHIVSISIHGVRSEVMLHALEEKKIYVSAGSACSSHDKKTSSTLLSIGLPKDLAESTIRISFSKYNNKEEIEYFLDKINELLPKLRLK